MRQSPRLQLVAEYGPLTAPQRPAKIQSILPAEYPRCSNYRPFMLADKQEETVHTLQLIVWTTARDYVVWGMPYTGMSVWDLTSSSLVFTCYGYRVEIEGQGLCEEWRFREALGKHRIKSICEWNPAVHKRPSARTACMTRITRIEEA